MTAEQQTDETALDFRTRPARMRAQPAPPAASPGLHPTQLLVLVHLVEVGPSRIGELAAKGVVFTADRDHRDHGLEAAGLVRRVPDTSDGRRDPGCSSPTQAAPPLLAIAKGPRRSAYGGD